MYENALAIKTPPADKILPGYFRTKKLRSHKIDKIIHFVLIAAMKDLSLIINIRQDRS